MIFNINLTFHLNCVLYLLGYKDTDKEWTFSWSDGGTFAAVARVITIIVFLHYILNDMRRPFRYVIIAEMYMSIIVFVLGLLH